MYVCTEFESAVGQERALGQKEQFEIFETGVKW